MTPSDPSSGSRASSFRCMALLVFLLLFGLALRGAHLTSLDGTVFEWEADGFVQTWEGRPWGAWNRLRPPALGMLLSRLDPALHLPSVPSVRWACVGLSLLGLLAALLLGAALSQQTGLPRRSMLRAGVWATGLWAVHPTLIRASVSPTPELLLGPALCLLLALLVMRRHGGVLPLLGSCAAASLLAATGGVITLMALAAGLLVYCLPLPRLPAALAGLLLLATASGTLWVLDRGPDASRQWLPDTAGVHSVMALLDVPPPNADDLPTQADRRELLLLDRARRGLVESAPLDVALRLARRFGRDVLGPARLQPLLAGSATDTQGPLIAVATLDLFLRGGLLLFACAVVGLLGKRRGASSWPRAGVVVGCVVLLLLAVAGAIGPLSMAPFDLLLLGLAAGGVAGGDPTRRWTRRLAFAVGGVLLCTLLYTAGVSLEPLSPWVAQLNHPQPEGALLVGLLDSPNPEDVQAELRTANLLMRPTAPLLRMPEAAVTHALQATHLRPDEDGALEVLVHAEVEAARYREAARLAESGLALRTSGSFDAKRMELLLEWVRQEARLTEGLPPGR